jgi:hypothetical protein
MNVGSPSSNTSSLILARKLVIETFEDEILKILLKNSNLTRKQFETLLIDTLANDLLEEEATSRARPKLRTDRGSLSRGSFDRTLIQGRRNIIEAVYTILLLGYTGLFETTQLEPFLEVGSRLKVYVESRGKQNVGADREMRSTLSKELTEILESLVRGRRKKSDPE